MQISPRLRNDDEGFAIVYVLVVIVTLICFVALAVDVGMSMRTQRLAILAGDAAVLTGATMLERGGSDADALRAAQEILRVNLLAQGNNRADIDALRLPNASISIAAAGRTKRAQIIQQFAQEHYFASIFPGIGTSMQLSAASAAAFTAPDHDADPSPIHVILALDTSTKMVEGSQYGDTCPTAADDPDGLCKYYLVGCPLDCLDALTAAKRFSDELLKQLTKDDTLSLVTYNYTATIRRQFVKTDSPGKLQLSHEIHALSEDPDHAYSNISSGAFAAFELAQQVRDFQAPIIVVLMTNHAWPDYNYDGAHEIQPYEISAPVRDANCPAAQDVCREELDICMSAIIPPDPRCFMGDSYWDESQNTCVNNRDVCYNRWNECLRNVPLVIEENANTLLRAVQELAHHHGGRAKVYTVVLADLDPWSAGTSPNWYENPWDSDPRRKWNVFRDLASDFSTVRTTSGTALGCAGKRREQLGGKMFNPQQSIAEMKFAAKELVRLARDSDSSVAVEDPAGAVARLVAPGEPL